MRKYLNNNDGLTLVEILTALVLLSIVLVTFMTFFTQSAKFTAHNHETLTAVQVAEDVVAIVREEEKEEENKVIVPTPVNDYVCTEMTTKINEAKKSEEFGLESLDVDLISVQGECEGFNIDVTLSKKLLTLGKAAVLVQSSSGKGINTPEFRTEMYFEVSP